MCVSGSAESRSGSTWRFSSCNCGMFWLTDLSYIVCLGEESSVGD